MVLGTFCIMSLLITSGTLSIFVFCGICGILLSVVGVCFFKPVLALVLVMTLCPSTTSGNELENHLRGGCLCQCVGEKLLTVVFSVAELEGKKIDHSREKS